MRRSAAIGWLWLYCSALSVLVGCGGPNPAAPNPTTQDPYQAFVKQLRAAGASVVENNEKFAPGFSGEVHRLTVNGSSVDVYVYATPEDASADAARITPDGGTFLGDNSGTIFERSAPPHFYKKNRLIVLYVGTDSQLLGLLTSLLGPQFAGQ